MSFGGGRLTNVSTRMTTDDDGRRRRHFPGSIFVADLFELPIHPGGGTRRAGANLDACVVGDDASKKGGGGGRGTGDRGANRLESGGRGEEALNGY